MASDLQIRVEALESQHDHAGIVRVCNEALITRLSCEDYVFALRKWARHLSTLNPEGWVSEITSALRDALDEVEDDDPSLAAQLLATAVASVALLGLPQHALEFVRRYEALVASFPTPGVIAYQGDIQFNLARTYEAGRDPHNAEQHYIQALGKFRASQVSLKAGMTLNNLAHLALKDGRVGQAKEWAAEAHSLIPGDDAVKLSLQGKIALAEGLSEQARVLFTAALDHPTITEYQRIGLLHALAETDLLDGHRDAAMRRAEDALQLAYRLPNREAVHELEAFLIKVYGG